MEKSVGTMEGENGYMDNILKQFKILVDELQAESSKNAKVEILKKYKNNANIKRILEFIYNPYILTGISDKKLNKIITKPDPKRLHLDNILGLITYLKHHNTGTDINIQVVQTFQSENQDYSELIGQIATKSLKLGGEVSTLNKAFGNFIPVFDLMLAESYKDFPDYINDKEFIITEKIDGVRAVCYFDNNTPIFRTRNGLLIEDLEELTKEALETFTTSQLKDVVWDGELLITDSQLPAKDAYRATMKIIGKDGPKNGITFHIFDTIYKLNFEKGSDETSSAARKAYAELQLTKTKYFKYLAPLYEGNDPSVIPNLLDQMLQRGKEGLMINIASAPWIAKRTKNLLKVKGQETADVKVIAIIEGTGKNKGKLGAVLVQFIGPDKNLHTCLVGSGFSDEERIKYWGNDYLIGKIIEIHYTDISSNQDDNNYSLRFPRFKHIREDKNEISMH